MLKSNLIANFLGQGWVALMGLAFIPLYIKYLGIESYGLIGLFAVLQAWLVLLDMGMTPVLGREMARFTGGVRSAQSIRDLLRSIEVITIGMATILGLGIWATSGWLANNWLKTDNIPIESVASAFTVMGLVTALRFLEGIYRSSIIGLQKQVLFNAVNSAMVTLRNLGAVVILAWISPTIEAFFFWQGVISFATLTILASITYTALPRLEWGARFSLGALREVWQFAGGMVGITFLSLLLTQVDKVLLSKFLSLSEYGYYTLAATVATSLLVLINPITQALYPRLCESNAKNDNSTLTETFHLGSQLISITAGSVAVVMIVFAENFLRLWAQNEELVLRTAPLLQLLMLGNLLNGLMYMPYMTQLAVGWISLTVKINIAAVALLIPSVLWATINYGAIGAAVIWVTLNAGYVFLGIHFMFQRILIEEKWRWYIHDVLKPLVGSCSGALFLALIWPSNPSVLADFILLTLGLFLTLVLALSMTPHARRFAVHSLKSYAKNSKAKASNR